MGEAFCRCYCTNRFKDKSKQCGIQSWVFFKNEREMEVTLPVKLIQPLAVDCMMIGLTSLSVLKDVTRKFLSFTCCSQTLPNTNYVKVHTEQRKTLCTY